MDLNAPPLPEEEEGEATLEGHCTAAAAELVAEAAAPAAAAAPPEPKEQRHFETPNKFYRPVHEDRRWQLKREYLDDRSPHASQPFSRDQMYHYRTPRYFYRSRVPRGWLDCPPFGQEICCIIPSKVPLGEFFDDYIVPEKRYSFRQVIHQQRVLGRKLGLVIDLTNTDRYYQVSDWYKEGIKHIKIQCRGWDSIPDNECVNSFVYEVSQFLSRQKHSKKYVLVHCTHGHNRTGYMIVHYLMRTKAISVTQAIQLFAEVRPPGIYRSTYIDALYKFYHERKPEMVTCPPTPDWKESYELGLNGEAVPDNDNNGGSAALLHENNEVGLVMTNDEVLGDNIPYHQQASLRIFCYQMLFGVSFRPRGYAQFPGCYPVLLNRDNLQLLRQRYYHATWIPDGTRYMMLMTMDGCYLIDRNFCFRRVQMRFPCKHINEGLAERIHHFTLLDGEMIIDTLPDSKKQERRYLIYDLMAVNQVSVVEKPFAERWEMIDKEIIEPRDYERLYNCQNGNPCYIYDSEPFKVARKESWLLSAVAMLLKESIPKLLHKVDGLIFKGWDDAYVPRAHEGLLKWKYPVMDSVDFLFEIGDDNGQLVYLYERGERKLMEGLRVVFRDAMDPFTYSGKIVECSWDAEEDVWVFIRIRTDKVVPNGINTYRKVMQSIRDTVTEKVLLHEIQEIIQLPMYVNRIQSDSKAHSHTS